MAVSNARIIEMAMALRANEPSLWDDFVIAVQGHAADMLAETLRAPPEMLYRAQGMAIEASEFASTLVNAPRLHEARQQSKMGKRDDRHKHTDR